MSTTEIVKAAEKQNELVALPERQTDALLVMIQGAVMTPGIDVQVIERLWSMQKEAQDRDAKAAFAKAKAEAQEEMPPAIMANRVNEHTESTYPDLSAVNTKVVPVYSKHGFSLSFDTGPSEIPDHILVKAELMHKQGFSKNYQFDLPVDNLGSGGKVSKTLIHGKASSVSYGQRYITCLIWNIATGHDNDGNMVQKGKQGSSQPNSKPTDSGKKATDKQVAFMKSKLEKSGKAFNDLKAQFNIEVLDDITMAQVNSVISWIEK